MPRKIIIISLSLILLFAGAIIFGVWKSGTENQSAEAAATKSGLVGHWTMDSGDINGTKMYDKSGKANNGTIYNGHTTVLGKIKQAKSFVGASYHYIDLGKTTSLNFEYNTPFSGAVWIKPSTLGEQLYPIIISNVQSTAPNRGWDFLFYSSTGQLNFQLISTWSSNALDVLGTKNIIDGKWHHVAFTYDGTYSSGGVKFYVDGVNDPVGTINYNSLSATISNSTVLSIGIRSGGGYPFTGQMDDFRIYDRVLSAQEIAQLYSATGIARENTPQKASSTVSAGNRLIGYWTMDAGDNSGGKMLDRSGMNTPGSMVGTTTSTGRIKEARTFNGTTNYISLFTSGATTSTLSPTSQVTISAWIKLAATGSWSWIASNASLSRNVTGGYGLLRNSGGIYAFNVNVWSQQASTGVTAVVDGKWHHLVGTYNGTTMTAYFDGVAGTPVAYSSPITYYADEIFYIGGSTVGGFTYPWNGQIDDVRVYDYGMSAQEVVNLYNSAKTTHANAATKTGLVSYWTMNNEDRSRNLIYDKSGLNNNGTLVGTTTSTGIVKEARNFNGSTDYIDMGDKSAYSISNSGFTISGWFKADYIPAASSANRMWLLTKAYTTVEWMISINSWNNFYGKLVFCHLNAAATLRTCRESSSMMVAKTWTHFVFTIADTGAIPDVYINGTLNNGTSEDMGNTVVDTTISLLIGAYTGWYENEFDGLIDDIRIYNRVLSAQEIANLYSAAKTTFID